MISFPDPEPLRPFDMRKTPTKHDMLVIFRSVQPCSKSLFTRDKTNIIYIKLYTLPWEKEKNAGLKCFRHGPTQ